MGGKAEKNTYLGKIVTEAVVRYTASVFLWRRRSRSGRGGGYFAASVQILFSKQTPTADAFSLSRPREGRNCRPKGLRTGEFLRMRAKFGIGYGELLISCGKSCNKREENVKIIHNFAIEVWIGFYGKVYR